MDRSVMNMESTNLKHLLCVTHEHQHDLKSQCCTWRYRAACRRSIPISQRRGNREASVAANTHSSHPFDPTLNNLRSSSIVQKCERLRVLFLVSCIEHVTVRQGAYVVDAGIPSILKKGSRSFGYFFHLQLGDFR